MENQQSFSDLGFLYCTHRYIAKYEDGSMEENLQTMILHKKITLRINTVDPFFSVTKTLYILNQCFFPEESVEPFRFRL